MTARFGAITLALLLLAPAGRATVEAFGLPEQHLPGNSAAAIRAAVEPTPIIELGYLRRGLLLGRQDFDAGVALGAPILLVPGGQDLRLSFGAATRFELGPHWDLASGLTAFWATANDGTARSDTLGVEVGTALRWRDGRFYLGLPARLRSALFLHLEHSSFMQGAYDDRYGHGATNAPATKPNVSGPYDGWYGPSAWRLFAGLESGLVLGSLALHGGAGVCWSTQAQGLFFSPETGQVPLYVELDVRFAF